MRIALLTLLIIVVACTPTAPSEPEVRLGEPPVDEVVVETHSENAVDTLKRLLNGTDPYAVTYAVSGASPQGPLPESVVQVYFDGANFRRDILGEFIQREYVLASAGYFCVREESWRCAEVPLEEAGGEVIEPSVRAIAPRDIAGVTTRCFEASYPQGVTEIHCFAGEAPLYQEFVLPDARIVYEATSYDSALPADAFLLPVNQN